MSTATQESRVDFNQVNKGDLMAFTYWGKVDDKLSYNDEVVVTNVDTDTKFSVKGRDLITKASSADQFVTTKKSSKTKMAEILVHSFGKPLTVCFTKQDGTRRVLRGRLQNAEPLLGRSYVEDLDIENAHRLRQVDHRTLEYLIVDNVRYEI